MPLWSPSETRIRQANICRFTERIRNLSGLPLPEYHDLWLWSVQNREVFWPQVWEFCDVIQSRSWDAVLVGSEIRGTSWFPGARLNFAENLLRYDDDRPALVFRSESGLRSEVSARELRRRVSAVQHYLRSVGVSIGDRVAGFVPNLIETVIAMLATTSLGAIWSATSPDFGVRGALDRLAQITPKVLFAADGYFYNGKQINLRERVEGIVREVSSIEHVVLIPYTDKRNDLPNVPSCVLFPDLLRSGAVSLHFEQLPFDHPVYILFSSGTTGVPKCIVHGAGGTLLQHLKELVLHTDLKPGSRIFYFTTCGWMMWNWVVSGLAVGATVYLYDGSPTHPRPEALFDFAAQDRFSIFGTSAKFLMSAEKLGLKPKETHDLSALETICSTGSPLPPSSFDYVYRDIKTDLCLSSISGGTDIVSCFVLGNPTLPVYRGEIQALGLGMDLDVFDDETPNSLRGTKGELVCKSAFPSMPVSFWNDPNGKKYQESYFNVYPGVWRHGDWAEITERHTCIIYGRSDAVLNPGGVRIGTAEIYRQVELLDEVLESLVTAQRWENDERIILFVKLRPGVDFSEELRDRIRQGIREQTTPRHVPARIIAVPDIPKTMNGKIVELAVRQTIHGEPVKNLDALANPEALEYFRGLVELCT